MPPLESDSLKGKAMKCKEITAVAGCHTDLLGAKQGVTIHYEYGTDAAGKTILVSTRYTDPDGNPVVGADATNTVVGQCVAESDQATEDCGSFGVSNLVTDGTFDNAGGGGGILFDWIQTPAAFQPGSVTVSGGRATWPAPGAYGSSIAQTISGLLAGATHRLTFEKFNHVTGTIGVFFDGSPLPVTPSANGVWTVDFTPAGTSGVLSFQTGFFSDSFQIDNVTIYPYIEQSNPIVALSDCTVNKLAEAIADQEPAPAGVEFLVTRPTGATTIAAGTRKSVSVTTISADVTINGAALPEGFSWHMASQDAGYINTQIDIVGTDYIVTEAF